MVSTASIRNTASTLMNTPTRTNINTLNPKRHMNNTPQVRMFENLDHDHLSAHHNSTTTAFTLTSAKQNSSYLARQTFTTMEFVI